MGLRLLVLVREYLRNLLSQNKRRSAVSKWFEIHSLTTTNKLLFLYDNSFPRKQNHKTGYFQASSHKGFLKRHLNHISTFSYSISIRIVRVSKFIFLLTIQAKRIRHKNEFHSTIPSSATHTKVKCKVVAFYQNEFFF